jgi:hypothetical protein
MVEASVSLELVVAKASFKIVTAGVSFGIFTCETLGSLGVTDPLVLLDPGEVWDLRGLCSGFFLIMNPLRNFFSFLLTSLCLSLILQTGFGL